MRKTQEELDNEQEEIAKSKNGQYLIWVTGSTAHKEYLENQEQFDIAYERKKAAKYGAEKLFNEYYNKGKWRDFIIHNNYMELKEGCKDERKLYVFLGIILGLWVIPLFFKLFIILIA